MQKFYLAMGVTVLFLASMLSTTVCHALEISIWPPQAQRRIGNNVTVYLYAENAIDLISMGVKVSFNPSVFQVVEAQKYEDFDNGWVMDADAVESTTEDQFVLPVVEIDNNSGVVTMIGGRLMGSVTTGLSGKVLLGWIKFEAFGLGNSSLDIDVAKVHPNDPTNTFDNFVRLNGQVDEPAPITFAEFCVTEDACEGDANGDGAVNFFDLAALKAHFNDNCNTLPPGEPCQRIGDVNGDGVVNFFDLSIVKRDFSRPDCLTCP